MGGRIPSGIKSLTTRSASPCDVVGRDYVSSRTSAERSRVRKEPSESSAMGLLG